MQALIPNSLTLLRLVVGLAFPVTPPAWWLPLVVFGGVSDLLDGWLSRRWGQTGPLGQLLDPIADKVFVVAVAVTFVIHQRLTVWDLAGIAARDLVVTILTIVALLSTRVTCQDFQPRRLGKVATLAQCVLLIRVLISPDRPGWLIIITAGISSIAALDYALAAGLSVVVGRSERGSTAAEP